MSLAVIPITVNMIYTSQLLGLEKSKFVLIGRLVALVTIIIFDVMGRSIKSLVNSNQMAGYRSVRWDATNDHGQGVSAGMYIYTIQAGEFRDVRKMVLLK